MAAWTLLLPVAGYSLWWWHGHGRGQWRSAGAAALWLTLACALVPAAWPPAVAAALVAGVRGRSARLWAQLGLVVASPLLLLVGPWSGTLMRYPGRLLTGIEPSLAPLTAPDPWSLVVAGTGGSAGPPEWISIAVLGVLWLAAIAGAARRPGVASYALVSAGGAVVTGIVLTRVVVWVPPGEWARPAAVEWQVLMVGGLVLAACVGLDQVGAELRERALGFRHLATLGLALSAAAAVTLAGVWWALAGQAGLSRDPVGAVPPFVRNAQVSATPGRTLALEVQEGRVGWALIQDDFPRLGDVERGLIVSGDAQARARATSVVTRLVIGSADEQILADLVSLGVAHIWLWGGDADLRMAISNAPGLGVGTGDASQTVWPVPDSGRTILESGTERTVTGTGLDVPAGEPDRRLILAEPADARWSAELAATSLAPAQFPDGRQAFSQASAAGRTRGRPGRPVHVVGVGPGGRPDLPAGAGRSGPTAARRRRRPAPSRRRCLVNRWIVPGLVATAVAATVVAATAVPPQQPTIGPSAVDSARVSLLCPSFRAATASVRVAAESTGEGLRTSGCLLPRWPTRRPVSPS